jgi:hypothetical protein
MLLLRRKNIGGTMAIVLPDRFTMRLKKRAYLFTNRLASQRPSLGMRKPPPDVFLIFPYRHLPTFVMVDGEVLEGFDRRFGGRAASSNKPSGCRCHRRTA